MATIDLRDRHFESIDALHEARKAIPDVSCEVVVSQREYDHLWEMIRAQSPFITPEPGARIRWDRMTIRAEDA